MNYSGKLFVFEGPDGNGKTTIVENVYDSIKELNLPVTKLSFSGKSKNTLGELIYTLHHKSDALGLKVINQGSLQTLHVAAHIECIQNSLLPALKKGEILLLDRFWWSSMVYGKASGLLKGNLTKLIEWENTFWEGVIPSCLFLIKREAHPIRLELTLDKWEVLQKEYSELAKSEKGKYDIIELYNEASLERITQKVVEHILEY